VDDLGGADSNERFEESAQMMNDSFGEDDYDYRIRQAADPNQEFYEAPVVQGESLFDDLMRQLSLLELDDKQYRIAENLIGNLDDDGYLRRDLFSVADDLVFKYNISAEPQEVEAVLEEVQKLDPAGVGARDLQECLLLQLYRKQQDETAELAIRILMDCFEEFTKKHFDKMASKCDASLEQIRNAYDLITRLNPKPGGAAGSLGSSKPQYIVPDFLLTAEGTELSVKLNSKNAPDLRVNRRYKEMLHQLEHKPSLSRSERETLQFVKQKIDSARWFIDAIEQRQATLLKTMFCIAEKQREFFLHEGDEAKLKPMILKDVADEIQMDISTVSRVANSKYVQTDFGIYQLKYFFSEGIMTEGGEEVSNREVKKILQEMIAGEKKGRPLSDQKLMEMLEKKGYNIARRTVAKYREQLGIPVARLRKSL
jgi:RNA polymerase sigma-54 factor